MVRRKHQVNERCCRAPGRATWAGYGVRGTWKVFHSPARIATEPPAACAFSARAICLRVERAQAPLRARSAAARGKGARQESEGRGDGHNAEVGPRCSRCVRPERGTTHGLAPLVEAAGGDQASLDLALTRGGAEAAAGRSPVHFEGAKEADEQPGRQAANADAPARQRGKRKREAQKTGNRGVREGVGIDPFAGMTAREEAGNRAGGNQKQLEGHRLSGP